MKRLLVCLACIVLPAMTRADGTVPLQLSKTIPLPGVEGRFDHAATDLKTNRVFLAALGNNTVEVVDVSDGKRLHTITGLKKPTGILFLGDSKRLVVASGDDGTCRFYDGIT